MDEYEELYDDKDYGRADTWNIFDHDEDKTLEESMITRINQYKYMKIASIEIWASGDSNRWWGGRHRNERNPAYEMFGFDNYYSKHRDTRFEDFGIIPEMIIVEVRGDVTKSLKLPNFKFTDIVQETWETSQIRKYLTDNRFFFMVYKPDNQNVLRLMGCQFWKMPEEDIEQYVHPVWQRTQDVINSGNLWYVDRRGKRHYYFTNKGENPVCHVRNGAFDNKDTYAMPDGTRCQKRCFALDNKYIEKQIRGRYRREWVFIKSDGTTAFVADSRGIKKKDIEKWVR